MVFSLNEAYRDKFTYWCNALGEISLPWRRNEYCGRIDELPPAIKKVYEQWKSSDNLGVSSCVVSDDACIGIAYVWLFDDDYVKDALGCDGTTFPQAIKLIAEKLENKYQYARVYIGEQTDPAGSELLLLVPAEFLDSFWDNISTEFHNPTSFADYVYSVAGRIRPHRYLGFIDKYFVRNAEYYNGDSLSDDIDIHDTEHECFWFPISTPVLVFDGPAFSKADVIKVLTEQFAASDNEFFVVRVSEEDDDK